MIGTISLPGLSGDLEISIIKDFVTVKCLIGGHMYDITGRFEDDFYSDSLPIFIISLQSWWTCFLLFGLWNPSIKLKISHNESTYFGRFYIQGIMGTTTTGSFKVHKHPKSPHLVYTIFEGDAFDL